MIIVRFLNMPRHLKLCQTERTENTHEMKKKFITTVAQKKMMIYRPTNCVKNLFLRFHAPVDKLVMNGKVRYAALPKNIRCRMTCIIREHRAEQSKEKLLLEIGTSVLSYWI